MPEGVVSGRLAGISAGGLVLLGFASRLRYGYEWDELQLLHGAWNVAHGLVPYRDFFEHHPPLLQLMLAPIAAGRVDASWPLLFALRAVALAVVLAILFAYRVLLSRAASRQAAGWGPVALLLVSPVSGKLFDLRSDWVALLALLAALLLVVPELKPGDRETSSRHLVAGVLGGVAVCLTQKAIPLWLGVMGWSGAGAVARAGRRLAIRHTLALAVGVTLPPAFLALGFAREQAVVALYAGTIGLNLTWPREVSWQRAWWDSNPAASGPLVLALAAGARIAGGLRGASRPAAVHSLLAVLAVAGALAYLLTPAPWEQSLLFFVVPWMAGLAILALDRYAARSDAFRFDAVFLAATLVLIAAILPAAGCIEVLVVWPLIGLVMWRTLRSERALAERLRRVIVVMLLPGAIAFVVDRLGDLTENRAAAQARFAREVSRRLAPDEPVLAMWDHVLPFRPSATYHWFAHEGVLRRFARDTRGAETLDAEYADAVERGMVRLVIVNPGWVEDYLPRLDRLIERRCRLVADGYAGSDAYLCRSERGE